MGIRKDGFFLRAESFYNVASSIDQMDRLPAPGPRIIDSYGGVSLHKQSHGESFMALVANRFGGNGLYILDEPEAALSPSRILELMCHIHELEKKNSQFIISTHSPILMAYPGAEILYLTQDGIQSVSYKETEHYLVTKQFLNNPEHMCKYLFADDWQFKAQDHVPGPQICWLTNDFYGAMIIPVFWKKGVNFMLYNGYILNCVEFAPSVFVR